MSLHFLQFNRHGLKTKVLLYGYNWDNLEYASEILEDKQVRDGIAGVSFHCYGGNYTSPDKLVQAYPDTEIFFQECTA